MNEFDEQNKTPEPIPETDSQSNPTEPGATGSAPEEALRRNLFEGRQVEEKKQNWFEGLAVALILALAIRHFLFQAYKIPSGSMIPSLLIGDQLITSKIAYGVRLPFFSEKLLKFDPPERGEIVVFRFPEDPSKDFIKRTIGLPGERVRIEEGEILINDEPIQREFLQNDRKDLGAGRPESVRIYQETVGDRSYEVYYTSRNQHVFWNMPEIQLGEDEIFVMGDNRDRSNDSRFWGPVDLDLLEGRPLMIHFSWDGQHKSVRSDRIGTALNQFVKYFKFFLLLIVITGNFSCSYWRYLAHVTAGELKLLGSAEPIEVAIQQTNDADTQQKLKLVQLTADASAAVLGLTRDKQYTTVSTHDADFRIYVLTVAKADRLEPVQWWFPFAGRVPYLGFFKKDMPVQTLYKRYQDPRYDYSIRTAAAFSTLGFFADPVLPEFLLFTDAQLVNTVVHELVHATVYRRGESAWNETIATALGDAGAEILLTGWGQGGRMDSRDTLDAHEAFKQDRAQWAELVHQTYVALEQAYAQTQTAETRLQLKAEIIGQMKDQILELNWSNPGYRNLVNRDINHAFLLSSHIYGADPALQTQWTNAALHDYAATIAEFKRRAKTGEDLWQPVVVD